MPLLASIAAKEGTIIKKPVATTPVVTGASPTQQASVESRLDAAENRDTQAFANTVQQNMASNPALSEAQARAYTLAQAQQAQPVVAPVQPTTTGAGVQQQNLVEQRLNTLEQQQAVAPVQPTGLQPSVVPKPSQQRGITDTATGTPGTTQPITKPVQDEIDAQISPDLSKVTSGGSGSSVSTSGGGAPSGTTASGTTTPSATGATTQNQTSMDLLKDIQTAQFTYDSAADEQYRIAASNLENEITQMMIGRGMMFSSVAASALQNRLIALQVQFRQSAYEEFLQERSFKMDMAKFVADREDASFSKEMALAEYNLNVQQQQFSQWMQKQNLALQQAQFSYRKQQDALQADIANKRKQLEANIAGWQNQDSQFSSMLDKWKNSNYGYATADVAAYFGVKQNAQYSRNSNAIATKRSTLNQQQQALTQQSIDLGYADITAGALQGWYEESTKSYDVDKDPITQLGSSAQQRTYNLLNAGYSEQIDNKVSANTIASDIQRNYARYEQEMGSMLAQRLYNYWTGLAYASQKATVTRSPE